MKKFVSIGRSIPGWAWLITLFLANICQTDAQINLAKYYNPGRVIINNVYDHLKPEFTWSMAGVQQAEINEGINQLDENNVDLALFHLNKAISLDSTLWISRYYRGVCYKKRGDFFLARKEFERAIELNSKTAEPHIELGEMYIVMYNLKRAEIEFDNAVKKNPALPQGYYGRGNVALQQGSINRALRFFEKSLEVDSRFAEAYLMQAIMEMNLKQDDARIISLLNKGIEANPAFTQGYFWRGLHYLEKNNLEKCLADWDNVVKLNPLNPFFTSMRGFLYIELNDYSKAFADLKNSFKAQSEGINENKFTGYQTILDKKIDFLAAANYLVATGYGLKEDAFLQIQKSFCLLLSNRIQEALTSINDAEIIQPSATVYYLKALILENSQNHEQALEYYDKALTLDKDIFEIHRKKCVYHFELKDYKSAYTDLNEMFRLQRGSPVGHRFRGLIRAAQGFLGPAIADLNEYIKTDTTDAIAIRARYTCLIVLKKWEESKKDAEWILKKSGTNWNTYLGFVTEYLEAGDTTYAITLCDNFSQVVPQYHWNQVKAVEIVISQRNWDDAEVRIERIISMTKETNSHVLYSLLNYWKGLIAHHKYHNPKEAISLFDKSLKLNSDQMDARYAKAEVYVSTGQRKKALNAFKELMNWGYKDAKVKYESLLSEKN